VSDDIDVAAAPVKPADTWKDFAERINASWRKGVECFIATGKLLLDAKAELEADQFASLVQFELAFDASVTRKLMRIGNNSVLCAHAHKLPPSWSTLYELTKFNDEFLKAWFADGTINPKMQRKDVMALRNGDADGDDAGDHHGDDPRHVEDNAGENHKSVDERRAEETFRQFFKQAAKDVIIEYISDTGRFDEILGASLDRAGVKGMLKVTSKEFHRELRACVQHVLELKPPATDSNAAPRTKSNKYRSAFHRAINATPSSDGSWSTNPVQSRGNGSQH
jgi:hypothetical protein